MIYFDVLRQKYVFEGLQDSGQESGQSTKEVKKVKNSDILNVIKGVSEGLIASIHKKEETDPEKKLLIYLTGIQTAIHVADLMGSIYEQEER